MALVTRISMARGQGSLKISGNEKPHETYKERIKTQYRMNYRITQLETNSYAYFSRAVIVRCSPSYSKMGISSLEYAEFIAFVSTMCLLPSFQG